MPRRPRVLGPAPIDLYVDLDALWPRIGRPPQHDLSTWRVVDDWPADVPIGAAEADLFEGWFGDLFDDLFKSD